MSLTVMWGIEACEISQCSGSEHCRWCVPQYRAASGGGVVVETYGVFSYLPVLLISGLLTGFVIGLAAGEMLKRIRSLQF